MIDNELVRFNGRFGGVPVDVFIPMGAVVGIYARENGQGMVFDGDENPMPEPPSSDPSPQGGGDGGKRPSLKVVK